MAETIVVEQELAAPPDAVWLAVTVPERMRSWYFEQIDDFRAEVGFTTRFDVTSGGRVFRHLWEVTAVVPQERLTYEWRYAGFPGVGATEWRLAETPAGTRLVLTWTEIERFPREIPEFRPESGRAGWEYFLRERLPGFLRESADAGC